MSFYDHNYSSGFSKRNRLSRLLLKHFLKRLGRISIVSEHLRENYNDLVSDMVFNSIQVETPYVPLSEVGSMGSSSYPREFHEFLSKHPLVLINAAWKLVDDAQGSDLYGLKGSLEVFLKNYTKNPVVGFVLIVGCPSGYRYEELRRSAEGHGNVFLLAGEHDLCGVLTLGDSILLRTTSTDGDSLSVREALELNRPVIASDVVNRPEGTVKYEYGLEDGLELVMVSVLNKKFSEWEEL